MEWWKDHIHLEERESVVESLRAAIDGTGRFLGIGIPLSPRRTGRGHTFMIGLALRETRTAGFGESLGRCWTSRKRCLPGRLVQESEVRLTTLAAMVPEILYSATPDGMTRLRQQEVC